MKSFLQFIVELVDRAEFRRESLIAKNPTTSKLRAQTEQSSHKALRYIKHGKDVYTVGAEHMFHGDLAKEVGLHHEWGATAFMSGRKREPLKDRAKTGFIYHDEVDHIKAHPDKLHGWIEDRHIKANDHYIGERPDTDLHADVGGTFSSGDEYHSQTKKKGKKKG